MPSSVVAESTPSTSRRSRPASSFMSPSAVTVTIVSAPIEAFSSSGVPSSSSLPWSMMPMRSQSWSASSMLWVVRTTVWPRSCRPSRISQRLIRLCGSRPAVGSSRKRMAGLWRIARATISRCAMPPESAITGAFARSVRWKVTSSSSEAARARAADMPKKRPWK